MDSFLKCVFVRAVKHMTVHGVHPHNCNHVNAHTVFYNCHIVLKFTVHFILKLDFKYIIIIIYNWERWRRVSSHGNTNQLETQISWKQAGTVGIVVGKYMREDRWELCSGMRIRLGFRYENKVSVQELK